MGILSIIVDQTSEDVGNEQYLVTSVQGLFRVVKTFAYSKEPIWIAVLAHSDSNMDYSYQGDTPQELFDTIQKAHEDAIRRFTV